MPGEAHSVGFLSFIPSSELSSILAVLCPRVCNTASAVFSFETCHPLAQAVDCIPPSFNPERRQYLRDLRLTVGTVFSGALPHYDAAYPKLSNSHFRG